MPNSKHKDNDLAFMEMAQTIARESDDPKAAVERSAAVGAIIVAGSQVLAASANRFPPQLRGKIEGLKPDSIERYTVIEHAERCALFDAVIAGKSTVGATMYCTRFPCADCARAIVYFGIGRLVLGSGFLHEPRWIESQRAAHQLLRSGGIKIRYLRLR